jgi:hypothetical protein
MKDVSKHTLDAIKKQHISPRPRSFFFLKRSTVWGLFMLSIVLGALAGAVIIFQLSNAEWELYRHLRHSVIEFLLLVVPYFWVLFLGGLTALSFYYFRRTSGGYRYRTATVVLVNIVLSMLGGTVIHVSGFSERLEVMFQDTIPFYEGVESHKQKIWMAPERGLLAGKISAVMSNGRMVLRDLKGKEWQVDAAGATWRGRLSPVMGLEIKLIGRIDGKDGFIAEEIRPWRGRGKNQRHREHPLF